MKLRFSGAIVLLLLLAAGGRAQDAASPIDPAKTVAAARQQIGVTTGYDSEYRVLPYPGGDVPPDTGVCTDVIIRALRPQGLDLQRAVHEDMAAHFSAYPHQWGLRSTDKNIDHRRVPNLMTFFQRRGWQRPVTAEPGDYLPGDIVTWSIPGGLPHIGLVSDAKDAAGCPLVIHNIGRGTQEERTLFTYKIIGHYRPRKAG